MKKQYFDIILDDVRHSLENYSDFSEFTNFSMIQDDLVDTINEIAYGTNYCRESPSYKKLSKEIGKYKIDILLNSNNEFIDILGIEEKKDFRSVRQRLKTIESGSSYIMDDEDE